MKKTTYFIFFLCCCFATAVSQTVPAALIELNSESGLSPKFICQGTTKVYFAGNTVGLGTELYVLDTNTNQISLVKDINPGWDSGPSGDAYLTVGDLLYFTSESNISNGTELWRSDGTAAGTYMVKDINPTGSSHISKMVYCNGKLLFGAYTSTTGTELWVSDGTSAGTNIITAQCFDFRWNGVGESNCL